MNASLWCHYRSPHRHLVGRLVTLTRDVTGADGTTHPAGTRARVVQATPRGLVLGIGTAEFGGTAFVLRGVDREAVEVGEGGER
jgi:hypothetical protein